MQVTQLFLIPLIGLEPILSCEKGILSPSCLPIPPQWHNLNYYVLSLEDNGLYHIYCSLGSSNISCYLFEKTIFTF